MKIKPNIKYYNVYYITLKQYTSLGLFTKKEMINKNIIGNPSFIVCEYIQI